MNISYKCGTCAAQWEKILTNLTAVFLIALISSFVYIENGMAKNPPTSNRSIAAINRVKNILTEDLERVGLNFGSPIFIRVFKKSKELEVWVKNKNEYTLFRTYKICTYSGELGPKIQEGDMQSPEGFYYVRPNRLNPLSQFHLSFDIGFPNRFDRFHERTGSYLMIHGSCVSIGCYAMTNENIEEIYALADAAFRNGQTFFRVHIFPFRMNEEKVNSHRENRWYSFWQNLKEGYDFFERLRIPPNVKVNQQGKYIYNMGS